MTEITRRNMLTGAAALTAAAPLVTTAPAQAAAPPAGTQAPGWYRYKVGGIEVTVVTDGANKFKFTDNHVTNKSRDEVNAGLAAAYYEKDMMTTPYNPVVVNTGAKLAVIDTGTGEANFERSKGAAGQFQRNLAASGIDSYEHRAIGDNKTPEGRASNRRVEIVVPQSEQK